MTYDEELTDELMRLVAAQLEVTATDANHPGEAFLSWLAHDLRLGLSAVERARDHRDATLFAERLAKRIAARRAEKKLPQRELRHRAATIVADLSHSLVHAARERCATILDLSVAAGTGRELWEEPCEEWLELPDEIPPSDRYLALRVAGDSMSPVLEPRDVILLKLDAFPALDDLVVAMVPDRGYVVKQVASIKGGHLELASFGQGYESVRVANDRSSILGTVIARFRRE